MSENINGYLLEDPLKTDNSGFSRWGFGKKGNEEYFIKEFLSPVYPTDAGLLGPELTEQKRQICRQFEEQKQLLFRQINEASDGNLVRIEEFFRFGTKYYISMQKVEAVEIGQVLDLPLQQKLLICLCLAHAVLGLHRKGLVHGDIKLNNVIFCTNRDGEIGARVIDVDSCFWEKEPPRREEEINGDQIYMAPETFRRIAFEEGNLTRKIDVYALGLLFHQILAGNLPDFEEGSYQYTYEALLDEKTLRVSVQIPPETAALLLAMLRRWPEMRPDLTEVCRELQQQYWKITGQRESGSDSADGWRRSEKDGTGDRRKPDWQEKAESGGSGSQKVQGSDDREKEEKNLANDFAATRRASGAKKGTMEEFFGMPDEDDLL